MKISSYNSSGSAFDVSVEKDVKLKYFPKVVIKKLPTHSKYLNRKANDRTENVVQNGDNNYESCSNQLLNSLHKQNVKDRKVNTHEKITGYNIIDFNTFINEKLQPQKKTTADVNQTQRSINNNNQTNKEVFQNTNQFKRENKIQSYSTPTNVLPTSEVQDKNCFTKSNKTDSQMLNGNSQYEVSNSKSPTVDCAKPTSPYILNTLNKPKSPFKFGECYPMTSKVSARLFNSSNNSSYTRQMGTGIGKFLT